MADAQRRMPAGEFREWQAMAILEPWGDDLQNLAQAAIRATMANAWRGANTRPIEVSEMLFDFIPSAEQRAAEAEEAANKRMRNLFRGLQGMYGKGD